MATGVIEREEWLLALGMLGDIRAELEEVVQLLGGDEDEEEDADA
jgi:hypothetical protein